MALVKAVQAGCFPVVSHLITVENMDINVKNSDGLNLLQIAICKGHEKLAKWLIDSGVSVNSTDKYGWSSLHDAVLCDQVELAMLLLDRGADPTFTTCDDELAIDLADYESPMHRKLRDRTLKSLTSFSMEDILGECAFNFTYSLQPFSA